MEVQLQRLVTAINVENRFFWARQWQAQGKDVIGVDGFYVPEEIIHAAGMLPWHLVGTPAQVSAATAYFPANSDRYGAHVLEAVLSGDLDFLKGVVASDLSDEARRLGDNLIHVGKPQSVFQLHIPYQGGDEACENFRRSLSRLRGVLEELGGAPITDEALRESTSLFNRMRCLLNQLYDLRKRDQPAITGTEALGIANAALVMPKEQFVEQLDALMPYLEGRSVGSDRRRPRILVSSDKLYEPAFINLIEGLGSLVVMDDIDSGSRCFCGLTELEDDPLFGLAKRYLERPPETRMGNWEQQVSRVIEWVKHYRVDGVINLIQVYDFGRLCTAPYFQNRLNREGIPNTIILRDYGCGDVSQLSTRTQAFLEMLAQ